MNKIAVVALGGNALLRGNQKGTVDEQEQNTMDTLENLLFLVKQGYNLIISHGNEAGWQYINAEGCRRAGIWYPSDAFGCMRGRFAGKHWIHDRTFAA